jgi:damage-control phosphatase, subfamily II, stand-alone protein
MCLRRAGFLDPYAAVKAEQTAQALDILPSVLAEHDAAADSIARMRSVLDGVFAGNIFDLGAAASAALFSDGHANAGDVFRQAKAKLAPRPWAIDCLDAVLARFAGPAHRKAILFVDNAGSDIVLGMLPFARELLRRGTRVVVAANAVASINDVTCAEMHDIVERAVAMDDVFREASTSGQLRVISSGNDLPVIDLRHVGREVAEEARGADLVVLEGMGRGIETNLYAELQCESLKLAMIKHPEVAAMLGGRLYDCVCQYHPGTSHGANGFADHSTNGVADHSTNGVVNAGTHAKGHLATGGAVN